VLVPANAPRDKSKQYKTYFTEEEEAQLATKILEASATCYCFSYGQIITMATEILKEKSPGALRGAQQTRLSHHWLRGFLARHNHLRVARGQVLQQRRARAVTKEAIKDYFDFIKDLKESKNYQSIWSLDESGFSQAELSKIRVLGVGSAANGGNVKLPEWDGHVSVLAAISTTGIVLPPYFIVEGIKKTMVGKEIEAAMALDGLGIPGAKTVMADCNEAGKLLKGSMSKVLWAQYFEQIFFPSLPRNHGPILIIIDG
jgi:hypothetical protein